MSAGPAHRLLFGCIADDLTGASDIAGALTREGMRVVQLVGVPAGDCRPDGVDAIVISLKTRNAPVRSAVEQAVDAAGWLVARRSEVLYFKYCSTFDSTAVGNIGPVADALLCALGEEFAVIAPAFPGNGRTVYAGHLFVGETLLENSSMRHHPVTPMTESDLVRLMAAQAGGPVGLVHYRDVSRGVTAIRRRLDTLRAEGNRYAVVDTLENEHLTSLARAVSGHGFVTGGSALAAAMARVMRERALIPHRAAEPTTALVRGGAAVISGSCSAATQAQVNHTRLAHKAYQLDASKLSDPDPAAAATDWAAEHLTSGPVLIYSTDADAGVTQVKQSIGIDSAEHIERTLGRIAKLLVARGVTKLVVAGGETSGAVIDALGIRSMTVGRELAPGVPILQAGHRPGLTLVLKSGNFGATDFFETALNALGQTEIGK